MNHVCLHSASFLAYMAMALSPAFYYGFTAPVQDAPRIVIAPDGKVPAPAPAPNPAPIPTSAAVAGERFELLTLTGYKGEVTWDVTSPTAFVPPVVLFEKKPGSTATGWRMGAAAPAQYPIGDTPTVEVYAVGDGAATVAAWGVKDSRPVKLATFQVTANRGPQPPPDPGPGPQPKPDPPTPAPEGFRVIFVYETSQAMTPAMQQVMFGEKVRAYLDAKSKGYRRYDKDSTAANEPDANLKALWTAARPKVTAVPCIIVAVGGKADIIPFPAGEDEAVAVFKKYLGE